MIDLKGTPYSLSEAAADALLGELKQLNERMRLLRSQGKLTPETLSLYYGQTRFDQIAESNAIEGSTLSVGDTQLAVLKGITISGHDPGFSRDARSLANALARLADLAKNHAPTDIPQLKELHELILEGQPKAGLFRNEEVRITGSAHRPPRTIRDVLDQIEHWESWSVENTSVPAPIRATILHAWLAHIHPFIDGNGRSARAINNLELIRAGFPPIIIRARRDRSRYLEALRTSDEAGDLTLLFELVLERAEDALRDLERAATTGQGYNKQLAQIRLALEGKLAIWVAAVQLLVEMIGYQLAQLRHAMNAKVHIEKFADTLSLDDYISLCSNVTVSKSWAFRIACEVPGLVPYDRLAWTGFRSKRMQSAIPAGSAAGPSLFWSARNPLRYPPWVAVTGDDAPGVDELTLVGEQWFALRGTNIERVSTTDMAARIADAVVVALSANPKP